MAVVVTVAISDGVGERVSPTEGVKVAVSIDV